ncbi:hypothetical protein OGAPHI_003396 [Ogataea philodendri]|uniref:SVP1-like protein 2 n=1 Tax=Ogataea philodendri TaxID=1378263 RepID=A0A9P8T5M9_9ASCO|nr:uncharacterized protein OGAPHI_003396 [Ogataea philodendri]KAH3666946.1 hypothetical protein OGAPHI_003396 [Ogataea philodendri]
MALASCFNGILGFARLFIQSSLLWSVNVTLGGGLYVDLDLILLISRRLTRAFTITSLRLAILIFVLASATSGVVLLSNCVKICRPEWLSLATTAGSKNPFWRLAFIVISSLDECFQTRKSGNTGSFPGLGSSPFSGFFLNSLVFLFRQMNTHRPIDPVVHSKEPAVLNAAFNQDQSCFAVCHETGFQVYNTDPMEPRMKRTFNSNGGIGLVSMLHRTNYVALVGGGKQPRFPVNKLCIWDDLKKKPSILLEFMSPILNVLLSRILIVVVLKNTVLIHAFESKPKLLAQHETFDNESGVAELSVNEQTSFLAFPGRAIGQIQLVDVSPANRDRNLISIIKAHKSKIQCLAISNSGALIASASQTGTIIRVHDTAKCSLRFELRRGLDRATVTSIKFSPDDSKLAVLSDKNTLHVFNLTATATQPDISMPNRMHFLGGLPLMPTYFKSIWSFVSYHIDTKDDLVNDTGVLGWADNESIVVLWKFKGIWEKYVLVENEKWGLVREGWRRFEE